MKLKALLFPFVLILLTQVVYSQTKVIKEADGLFYTKRYKEAYNLYQGIREKKRDRAMVLKMAECNYYIENYPQAQKYYAQYFTDTLYHAVPEFTNYANSARLSGNVPKAADLYGKILRNGDESVRPVYESYRFYLDNSNAVRVYDLDSTYNCIELDASASLDVEAAPMVYLWDFKDGTTADGMVVTHCFKKEGANVITLNIKDKATGYVRMNDTSLTVYVSSPPVKFKSNTIGHRLKQYLVSKFEAGDIYIYDYDILEYIWEMGDGDYAMGKKVEKKFNKLDNYKIRLTVLAKNKTTGKLELFASLKYYEVVDNYSDHSQTFKDNLNGEK